MPNSQNGWSVVDASGTQLYPVSNGGRVLRLRKGVGGEMLADFLRWFDLNIRDIDPGILDDWGWAVRPISGSSDITNHASGTAGDVDATKWPLGRNPEVYLTAAEIAKVRNKLKEYEGCIRWGGDYTGRKDPMHFELNKSEAEVARVWSKILKARSGYPIVGAIRAAYDRPVINGATWAFFLGQPLGPEVPTWDKTGRWQQFTNGAIYWHPAVDKGTAHVLWGDILKRFWALGGEPAVGWPTTDETATPDTIGRYNHLTGVDGWATSIYWSPSTGAKLVKGLIREAWGKARWEVGIGYPIDEEHPAETGIVQNFERGSILFRDGIAVVRPK